MTERKSFRSAFGLLACVATVMLSAVGVSAEKEGGRGIRLTKIGKPTWKPVDQHMFTAPIGNAASGYAEFIDTMKKLMLTDPPTNHVWRNDLGIAPGAPHRPPYNSELEDGIEANHYKEGTRFGANAFSNGNGVWIAWMTVAEPGRMGSSPDFSRGRIIPNALFPIHIKGVLLKGGAMFDPFAAVFDVPALNVLDPPYAVDGASHFPIFIMDDVTFGPPGSQPGGSYEYQIDMVDASGNGWHVVGQFMVEPQKVEEVE